MSPIRVVNCVFHGSLNKPIDLSVIQSKPLKGQIKSKLYKPRPHMLYIRFKKTSLLFFPTGRFRIMGGQFQSPESALRWFNQIGEWTENITLTLQTCTVSFKVNADCANIILQRYPNVILYEPELFIPPFN